MIGEGNSGPRVFGYAEDSLTLWALNGKLKYILEKAGDESSPSDCEAYYKPGFGRKGGDDSAQFGEFDFLLLSPFRLYLGESKWERSREVRGGEVHIDHVQKVRHEAFREYVKLWFEFQCDSSGGMRPWAEFIKWAPPRYKALEVAKRMAPSGSLTARSLEFILIRIWGFFRGDLPEMMDLLLYFQSDRNNALLKNSTNYRHVQIAYDGTMSGYVEL